MSDTAPKTDLRDDILATIDKTLRAVEWGQVLQTWCFHT